MLDASISSTAVSFGKYVVSGTCIVDDLVDVPPAIDFNISKIYKTDLIKGMSLALWVEIAENCNARKNSSKAAQDG